MAGLESVPAASTTRSASMVSPVPASRTPTARPPLITTRSTSVSGRIVRLSRSREAARNVSAVLIRTPSTRLTGAGPTPTAQGRLWSSTASCPAATAASSAAAWVGTSSPGPARPIGSGPFDPWYSASG
jgi:hypothetical protein